jgi:hypothetical protein
MNSISIFLKKTMGIVWNFDKYSTAQSNEKNSLKKIKKSKNNHNKEETCDELLLIEKNNEVELIGLSPMVILTPIEHIFSHQKHFMNIYYSRVKSIDYNGHINGDKDNSKKDDKNKNYTKKNKNEIVYENINDLSWTSICGQNREIKWMNAQEITEAGITTGCKKILTEVLKQT